MEIKALGTENGIHSFSLKGATPAIANTLRRSMLSLVPTMAIEEVEFRKNSSVLYDELIAHRLGLVPLKTDLKSYKLRSESKTPDEVTATTHLKLTCKVKGPKTVYSGDLKSQDPKVVPVHETIPIVKLTKNQEVEFEAVAVLGCGEEHMKWAPGAVWYTYEPTIKVNSKSKQLEEFKSQYPPQIFNNKGEIDAKLINTPALVDACEGVCDDIIKIDYNEGTFIFFVEPFGQLSPKEMMETAVNSFQKKLDSFAASL